MAPETPPKAVSSRLLTMKFMQRAVASAPASPDTEPHPSKKRKTIQSPAQGRISTLIDQASIQAALDDQEAIRQAALARHSTSDTHWVLKTSLNPAKETPAPISPLNIIHVGYGDIDSSNESGAENAPESGRTSTRVAKVSQKQKPVSGNPASPKDESSEDSHSDSDDFSSRKRRSTNSNASRNSRDNSSRSHSGQKSKPTQESVVAKDFREKRKKKEVRLNNISSISSVSGPSKPALTCYHCKQAGHKVSDCPKSTSRLKQR